MLRGFVSESGFSLVTSCRGGEVNIRERVR